jgi:hypothetical protein
MFSAPLKDLSTSGRNVSRDFMEGRTGNFIGVNLRSSLDNCPKTLEQSWIGITAISVRVLFLMPQADCDSVSSVGSDERNFVLETFLFSKQRESFFVD